MYVKADHELGKYFRDIVEDELNVKEVAFREDVSDLTSYSFKPQLRTVGPKYGKQLGGIREYLSNVDGNAAMKQLRKEGALSFEVGGSAVTLTEEDLLIDVAQKEGRCDGIRQPHYRGAGYQPYAGARGGGICL